MSLINEDIKKKISNWAEENADQNVFPKISQEKDSYYINRGSEKTYMMEYSFKTIEELKILLDKFSGLSNEQEMLRILTLGIMQNRFEQKEETDCNDFKDIELDNAEKSLPDFVYAF